MAVIDTDTLLPNGHVKELVADGEMTQLSRGQSYAAEGDTFEINGESYKITSVEEMTLGEMTDADAQREGSADLAAYKKRLVRAHGGEFEWDDTADVVRHQFEPQ